MKQWIMLIVLSLSVLAQAEDLWMTDFQKAQKQAKKEGKYLLLDFSGSDWCGWCKRLEREVFGTPEFKEYVVQHFVPVLVDFPKKKQQPKAEQQANRKLMDKYGVEGFPTIAILTADGDVVEMTGYEPGGSTNYIAHLNGILEKAKAK